MRLDQDSGAPIARLSVLSSGRKKEPTIVTGGGRITYCASPKLLRCASGSSFAREDTLTALLACKRGGQYTHGPPSPIRRV